MVGRFHLFLLAGFSFFVFGGCRSGGNTDYHEASLFGGPGAQVIFLPETHERIDIPKYRLDRDQQSQAILESSILKGENKCDIQQALLDRFGLSKLEGCSIQRYSSFGYLDYYVMSNPRTTVASSVEVSTANFKASISALNKMPKYLGHVFFGNRFAKEYVDSELKVGAKFVNQNFTSSSTSKGYAVGYSGSGLPATSSSPQLRVVFEVEETCQGSDIKELSKFLGEDEVLFLPLNPWKIVSKSLLEREGQGYDVHVKLREMLPCRVEKG